MLGSSKRPFTTSLAACTMSALPAMSAHLLMSVAVASLALATTLYHHTHTYIYIYIYI
jgi:hypothetical protein